MYQSDYQKTNTQKPTVEFTKILGTREEKRRKEKKGEDSITVVDNNMLVLLRGFYKRLYYSDQMPILFHSNADTIRLECRYHLDQMTAPFKL